MPAIDRRAARGVLALALALAASAPVHPQPGNPARGPTLLVTIAVDQMRADYLDRAQRLLHGGLGRLLRDGAVFERAEYPYATTVTCPGHATIATGTFPATHGIVANEWWSRADNRRVVCTDDAGAASVAYVGAPEGASHSARRLRVPTLGDRLRAARPDARVVAVAMKPRSAVMLGGHTGTAVTWFVDATHGWATSSAYSARPLPEVHDFLFAHPIDRERTTVWTPLDPDSYAGEDDAPGERPKAGWTRVFPHPLAGEPGTAADRFPELWKCSPFADAYVGAMAAAQMRAFALGQRGTVDLLAISFSGLDCVGHDFGPDSAEVHDTVLRLDRTLGTLFEALDAAVGRDRYVVALSADHGVSAIPEQRQRAGADAGRVLAADIRRVAESALAAVHGPGPHVAAVIAPSVYLTPAVRERQLRSPDLAAPAIAAIAKLPGILRVIAGRTLADGRGRRDPLERAAALSYHPAESGDLLYFLQPGWIHGGDSAASHGSPHAYDRRVPLLFMGASIKSGRYTRAASPADLAPTLAAAVGLKMAGADGAVLHAALR